MVLLEFVAPASPNKTSELWMLDITDGGRMTKLYMLKVHHAQVIRYNLMVYLLRSWATQVNVKCHNTTQASYKEYLSNTSRGELLHHNYDCIQEVS